ncbi:HAD family hydrolase [Marinomonas piezotolerans]|uniref:phosphoglycolate phosphatase n=1 Tax=Marinomonas piezotolerans TaxID=2213058 RepID=A0A370U8F7_9GAMM|nr:HAD hydrolase-like protein [Marinomonas piezotolerans]RDL44057.1 HAD family hydrolase [Marinomonas piezotolerans]
MTLIDRYDYYVFDCDGVILDSNHLKIEAMKNALLALSVSSIDVDKCCEYFAKNFGKSRFHHVEAFVDQYLDLNGGSKELFTSQCLQLYSQQCMSLYLDAPITEGFIEFVQNLTGDKFVASGSEQGELREILKQRSLSQYFKQVYGSPRVKSDLLASIIEIKKSKNGVMIGDALSDLDAAKDNEIDFIAYRSCSCIPQHLTVATRDSGFYVVDSWKELKRYI